ncbi:MAG: chemotaxis protein CheB [Methylomonas sp.]|nr:chemotaxis protein CheB [Methylomonas sp.]
MPKIALIGGSAGALSAIEAFFENLPESCEQDFAFIVVQHLNKDYKSRLDSLIAKWTSMKVVFASEGMDIEAGHVYIGQPGYFLALVGNRFSLLPPESGTKANKPIDFLCRSLAEGYGRDSVLLILSGLGDDGTEGARLIKQAKGRVLAQAPSNADFDGMPASAIAAGWVDKIFPAAELGLSLAQCGGDENGGEADITHSNTHHKPAFAGILELIREHAHNDMANYKQTTLRRRIERRMSM